MYHRKEELGQLLQWQGPFHSMYTVLNRHCEKPQESISETLLKGVEYLVLGQWWERQRQWLDHRDGKEQGEVGGR